MSTPRNHPGHWTDHTLAGDKAAQAAVVEEHSFTVGFEGDTLSLELTAEALPNAYEGWVFRCIARDRTPEPCVGAARLELAPFSSLLRTVCDAGHDITLTEDALASLVLSQEGAVFLP